MTEKEKMLAGEIYAPQDKELEKERIKSKELCYEYNNLRPTQMEEKSKILKELLGKMGNECYFEPPFRCDYGYNIEVGNNFYSNHNLLILDTNKVTFGDNVLIGPNCGFYCPNHPIDPVERLTGKEDAHPIKVGNNVWLGGNVVVLPGVEIGNNVVIGAGSVVTKSIPDNCVAVGNPCKVIKTIK